MSAAAVKTGRLFDELVLHAPEVRAMDAVELQYARRSIARAIADAEDITHWRVRNAVQRALFTVACELGCAVCGQPIKMAELETCPLTRQSLVHLWKDCSDRFAVMLGTTVDDALSGEAWL